MTKLTPEEILDRLRAENEEALTADGFEKCLVGICYLYGRPPLACYDYDLCIKKLMADGMDYDDAREFFEVNTLGSWVGDNTPVFVNLFTETS
jgi:hypothetical protein